jgi:hypothetical protein
MNQKKCAGGQLATHARTQKGELGLWRTNRGERLDQGHGWPYPTWCRLFIFVANPICRCVRPCVRPISTEQDVLAADSRRIHGSSVVPILGDWGQEHLQQSLSTTLPIKYYRVAQYHFVDFLRKLL